jgi:hypothetical protein
MALQYAPYYPNAIKKREKQFFVFISAAVWGGTGMAPVT